jgi:hypothetical protein
MRVQEWTVDIQLDEDDTSTHARAVLHGRDGVTVQSDGTARRNPVDAPIPEIGEELATARALSALAHQLMDVAAEDISNLAHPISRG